MRTRHSRSLFVVVLALLAAAPAGADEFRLVVQPIIDRDATRKAFAPLAEYLSKASGHTITLKTAYDYADFWLLMKDGKHYDLIFDGRTRKNAALPAGFCRANGRTYPA